MSPRKLQAGAS